MSPASTWGTHDTATEADTTQTAVTEAEEDPDKVDTAVYQRLTYRYIGPEGNRVTSVTGVAGDPNT